MEQGQCWMQTTKRKFSLGSSPTTTHNPSYDGSWEEQAFAEDAAGTLGGCIWPPRSYSCSFCRREFRSAQALGGHMNVHRRDRARLKQPSSPKNEEILFHHHDLENHHLHNPVQNNNPFTSLGSYNLYPSSVCGLAYNKTTNASSDLDVIASASASASSPSPNSKPLLAPPPVNGPLCISSIVHKTSSSVYSSESWSNLGGDHHRRFYSNMFYPEADFEKVSKGLLDSGCRGKGDDNDSGDADMAVSLNLVVCRAQPPAQFETKEADINCKRRKTDASSIPFLPKSSSVDHRHHVQPQVFELSPSSIEELDLELRLGNRSKTNWMEFSPGQGRSYTCAFCKRGFSNAQALGGHMNIHRRDRAKLRQSFEENLLSMDSSVKNTTDDQEPQPLEEKALFGMEYSGGDQQKHSSNDKKYKDDHALQRGKAIRTSDQQPNQLPLLGGMPGSINDARLEGVGEKKNDVDLELRLGLSRKRDQL